jgi:hypothetical protein
MRRCLELTAHSGDECDAVVHVGRREVSRALEIPAHQSVPRIAITVVPPFLPGRRVIAIVSRLHWHSHPSARQEGWFMQAKKADWKEEGCRQSWRFTPLFIFTVTSIFAITITTIIAFTNNTCSSGLYPGTVPM